MKYLLITLFVHIGLFSFGQSTFEYNYQKYMILDKPLEGLYSWQEAKDVCEDLTAFGYDNWELPDFSVLVKSCEERKITKFDTFWANNGAGSYKSYIQDCHHNVDKEWVLKYATCVRKTK